MTIYAFVDGIAAALIAVMVVLLIRLWAKTKLERWGRELTHETHSHLRDIKYQQERLLSGLERLETTARTQTSTLNDLRSRLSQSKTAV